MEWIDDAVELTVSDDGKGFAWSNGKTGEGHGMDNMRERARELGAEWSCDTAPGRGAKIRVRLHPQ